MWPLEDFDLLQRALILIELGGIGLQNAVDHQCDRAFGVTRAIHAPDVDLGVARLGGSGHDGHARGELNEVFGFGRAGSFQRDRCQHRYRCGNILQPLLLAPGGDDDGIVSGIAGTRHGGFCCVR